MTRAKSIRNASLTDADIPGIRKRVQTKQTTVAEEADRFDVGIETIRRAVRGETFRHIKDFLPEPGVPGHRAPVATKHPIPAPDAADAAASLKRFQEQVAAPDGMKDAVDEFLARRKGSEDKKEGDK
jgi:hypothetical protein